MTESLDRAKAQLAAALAHVEIRSAPWRPWAGLALIHAAAKSVEITSDDVWRVLTAHSVPAPLEPRAMGPVMLAGVRKGLITPTERFLVSQDPATSRNHGRPQRVYASHIWELGGSLRWPVVGEPNLGRVEPNLPDASPIAPLRPEAVKEPTWRCRTKDDNGVVCDAPLGDVVPVAFVDGWVLGKCVTHKKVQTNIFR